MKELQELFDQHTEGIFRLEPGLYEGPLVIRHPCVIDGQGATIRLDAGIGISVLASGVRIKNLSVEITGDSDNVIDQTAIAAVSADTRLENVTVRGHVIGFPEEYPLWNLPSLLTLRLTAGESTSIPMKLAVPAAAGFSCKVEGLSCPTTELRPGKQRLLFQSGGQPAGSVLHGSICIDTLVRRRIMVAGVFQPAATPETSATGRFDWGGRQPAPLVGQVRNVRRGERQELDGDVSILFTYDGTARNVTVDCFCYSLKADGKVSGDGDFVFYGNPVSRDGSVQHFLYEPLPATQVELKKVGRDIEKIAICYVIYQEGAVRCDFSQVRNPTMRVYADGSELVFPIDGLKDEQAIVAAEIYRHHAGWKMRFIGAGYKQGLEKLCGEYGIDVE
jgi:stress response protein SCP2